MTGQRSDRRMHRHLDTVADEDMSGAEGDARTRGDLVNEIAELRRALGAATAASLAKSRYLATVSHEIRSPLNAIYGYAQLIEQGGEIEPVAAGRVIRRSAEHLANLVEGLLDIAAVEQGVVRLDATVFRLRSLVNQVADMFRPQAEQKGLVLSCEFGRRVPDFVRMDERRLRQALINLVSNAVKFTDRGSVAIRLDWASELATFEVRDTGPGIADEDQEAIFTPYARGTTQIAAEQSGAGLGLAITSAIVRMLGGDLTLESRKGHGACFRMVLMAPQVSADVDPSVHDERPTGYAGPRRTLLLVDDDCDHLQMLRLTFEEIGFAVETASDGTSALAMSRNRHFDAAILDVSMPGMSGWDVASRLRAEHGKDLQILMLSANAAERHGLTGQIAAHDEFLLKPIDFRKLTDAVGRRLRLDWIKPAPASAQTPSEGLTPVLSEAARVHADKLKALVQIGHVRGLEGEIRQLAEADPGAAAFVSRLHDCLDRFDLVAMRRVLEEI